MFTGDNPGELRGCHNDVFNMKEYIQDVHGFEDENITILMDDGNHTMPTRENILAAYSKLVEESQPGDAVFCHYSGHGGKLKDDNGDEGERNEFFPNLVAYLSMLILWLPSGRL